MTVGKELGGKKGAATGVGSSSVPRTVPQRLTQEGQVPVIGKMKDLNTPETVLDGEFKIADYLPDMGNP